MGHPLDGDLWGEGLKASHASQSWGGQEVSVQTPPVLGVALEAQAADPPAPSPLAGEGRGEGG